MNDIETTLACRKAGITLNLNLSTMKIQTSPKHLLTPELKEAIRTNRDELIRHLLLLKALDHLGKNWVLGTEYTEEMEELRRQVDNAYHVAPLPEYREVLREWVRAGLREAKKAERQRTRQ